MSQARICKQQTGLFFGRGSLRPRPSLHESWAPVTQSI